MTELVDWLRQQLDEDERVATKAAAMRYDLPSDAPWERERLIADQLGGKSRVAAVHRIVAVFANPVRVLAEVEAKRGQLLLAQEMLRPVPIPPELPRVAQLTESLIQEAEAKAAKALLTLLAQPYAGRGGWREEWAA